LAKAPAESTEQDSRLQRPRDHAQAHGAVLRLSARHHGAVVQDRPDDGQARRQTAADEQHEGEETGDARPPVHPHEVGQQPREHVDEVGHAGEQPADEPTAQRPRKSNQWIVPRKPSEKLGPPPIPVPVRGAVPLIGPVGGVVADGCVVALGAAV